MILFKLLLINPRGERRDITVATTTNETLKTDSFFKNMNQATNHQNAHLLLAEEAAEQLTEHVTHGGRCVVGLGGESVANERKEEGGRIIKYVRLLCVVQRNKRLLQAKDAEPAAKSQMSSTQVHTQLSGRGGNRGGDEGK